MASPHPTAAASVPQIAALGNWTLAIRPTDLIDGPGSDLIPSYQSAPDQIELSIKLAPQTHDASHDASPVTWRLDVRRSDFEWPTAFTLAIRRAGAADGEDGRDGHPADQVHGGSTYLVVGTEDKVFLTGQGDAPEIPVQLQLGGVSDRIAPGPYGTELVFTVVQA